MKEKKSPKKSPQIKSLAVHWLIRGSVRREMKMKRQEVDGIRQSSFIEASNRQTARFESRMADMARSINRSFD